MNPLLEAPLLSVIIPVYNEESTVGEVIDRVRAVDLPVRKQIIVVDDGSTDHTGEVLSRKAADVDFVHYSRINHGKGAAIRVGLTYADGGVVIIQDADLELNPEEYVRLLAPILAGEAAIVYGSRFLQGVEGLGWKTVWANRALTALTNALYGTRLTDMETAYKAFRREVAQAVDLRCRRFEFEPEFTAKATLAGYTIREVPISYNPRTADQGKKITAGDGLAAVRTLLGCRFARRAAAPPKLHSLAHPGAEARPPELGVSS